MLWGRGCLKTSGGKGLSLTLPYNSWTFVFGSNVTKKKAGVSLRVQNVKERTPNAWLVGLERRQASRGSRGSRGGGGEALEEYGARKSESLVCRQGGDQVVERTAFVMGRGCRFTVAGVIHPNLPIPALGSHLCSEFLVRFAILPGRFSPGL